jgi:hypothetical protein
VAYRDEIVNIILLLWAPGGNIHLPGNADSQFNFAQTASKQAGTEPATPNRFGQGEQTGPSLLQGKIDPRYGGPNCGFFKKCLAKGPEESRLGVFANLHYQRLLLQFGPVLRKSCSKFWWNRYALQQAAILQTL